MDNSTVLLIAGVVAGAVNGLLGAGGGMVLVPLLTYSGKLQEREVFPASVAIILPICIITLLLTADWTLTFGQILPYLLGSIAGGLLSGILGRHIPTVWLHRILGIIVLWGGIRYLC
ncbi:MAG: sulfite exporter TauE/SafE family protein [Oscillospiraceae bacterium]|nr:sulfite exporter TauE/SafE family protein [Oscillospiraceae bacterium]